MPNSLELINQLQDEMSTVLARGISPARQGQALLAVVVSQLEAESGALAAWERGGRAALASTAGLSPALARAWRKMASSPTGCPGEPIGRMGMVSLKPGEEISSGWRELDQAAAMATTKAFVVLWPIIWLEGVGLLLLRFTENHRWTKNLPQTICGQIGMAVSTAILAKRAAQSGEDYRRIFQGSPDMLYISSRDGRWLDVNPAGVRMLGYESLDELLAQEDIAKASYYRPEDRKPFMEAIERRGYVRDYEVTFKRKDSSPVEVSITGQVRKEEGQIVGYEGIIKDITQAKRTAAKLAQERAWLAGILDVMPVCLFVVDAEHKVVHWNRSCQELTGYSTADMLGSRQVWKVFDRPEGISLADVVLSGDDNLVHKHYGGERLRKSPVAPEAWEAENFFPSLGGRPKHLFFTAAPLRDAQGRITGAVEAIVDTSHIRELEIQVAESETLYRTLVESTLEGIALHDGRNFLFTNNTFLKMFGLRASEEAHGDFLELIAPGHRHSYLDWTRRARGNPLEESFSGKGVKEDGSTFDLELTAVPTVYGGNGVTLYTARDVSYRKRMEEQLVRSERLAATGKLAFDIAHEVNNPLGGILTFSHLLKEDLDGNPDLAETVEKIIRLTNRCKIIVRGLLDFARDDSPEKELVQLNQVVEDVMSLIDGHIILRRVKVLRNLDRALPMINGHRTKLEQVILNLVINAAEAMEGQGNLLIRSHYQAEEAMAVLEVEDDGPGMDEEVRARVLEPFFTTKERGRGTGLGLSISHGIIKQHEGRLEVESRPGEGSIFRLLFPAAAEYFLETEEELLNSPE